MPETCTAHQASGYTSSQSNKAILGAEEGTSHLTDHRGPKPIKRRILCVDGGGILGTFPAAVLAELEQHLDNPIGSYFDLIAGTSTGGIIAIALALGHRASEILKLYESSGLEIFCQSRRTYLYRAIWKLRILRHLYRSKYNPDALRLALFKILQDRCIGEAKTRLIIPAWNPTDRTVYIYKTAHHPRLKTDYKSPAIDAALATSAAPTYFPHHIARQGIGLLDGGIWANNPIAIATVEAIAVLRWPPESLHILSLGCTEESYTVPRHAGIGQISLKLHKLFMDGQSHGSMGIAKLLTGHEHERTAIYRINHTAPYGEYGLDDARVIPRLKGLGHAMGRDRLPILSPIFFDQPIRKFHPHHHLKEKHDDN